MGKKEQGSHALSCWNEGSRAEVAHENVGTWPRRIRIKGETFQGDFAMRQVSGCVHTIAMTDKCVTIHLKADIVQQTIEPRAHAGHSNSTDDKS